MSNATRNGTVEPARPPGAVASLTVREPGRDPCVFKSFHGFLASMLEGWSP